jgi:hypothetical protein
MYIAFEGMLGTACAAFGVRWVFVEASDVMEGVRFGVWA